LEDRIPRLPGLKKNFSRNRWYADMVLAVFAQQGAVGVDDRGRI